MIESASNQRIKEIKLLQKDAGSRRERGLFVIEGARSLFDVMGHSGVELREIYVTKAFLSENSGSMEHLSPGSFETVSEKAMDAMSDTKTPQGILAVAVQPKWHETDIFSDGGFVLALDGVRDPGNMGTIFRTALAAGINGLVLSEDCVDVFNPKVVRATMSAVARMPFIYTSDLPRLIRLRRLSGAHCMAAAIDDTAGSLFDADMSGDVIVVVGNEAAGVSRAVMNECGSRLYIPMNNNIESLNVSVAAALIMYERSRA